MELYKVHPQHYVAVDCVILGYQDEEIKLLLYPRSFEPYKGILKQTTGLEQIFLEQVASFSDPKRDPEARVISLAYYALIRIDLHDEEKVIENGAYWVSISKLPNLIFDHQQMFEKSLVKLQQKAGYSLCGSELLPEMFTLIQLRKLYEAIFQREFDPGNFRKKILSLGVLEKLNEKDISESRKGAFYYKAKSNIGEIDVDRIVKF